MDFISIILFFVYTFLLGFTITSFVKNSDNFLERNLMRIGFGLALLPFLGLILNLLRIPIDWKIILALSITYPLYHIIKNKAKPKLRFAITKTDLSIFVMLAIFFVNFYVYASGAFNYPYLENDDPWSHAMGVKYVSIEKTVFGKTSVGFHYIDPYPPTYDLLLGILHQTNDSVYWTLKFFNALIISLSIIFFYFFVKEFTQDRNKALFASFALASIPAFLSHFIWGIALTMPLYFVTFYAIERIKYDKKWWIVASLVMVTTLTSSPTHSTYFGLFFVLYLFTKIVLERDVLMYPILSGLIGALLSFIFWWLPMILKHGFYGTLKSLGIIAVGRETVLSVGGTGDRTYSFSDFFIAQKQNMINNPIGIGIFLSILTIIALVFLFLRYKDLLKKENHWLIVTFIWFIFTLYAVNAAKMPIKLSPFRAWMLLAIPVCILSAEGFWLLLRLDKVVQWIILGILQLIFIFNYYNFVGISYILELWTMVPFINHLSVYWFFIPFNVLIAFVLILLFKILFNKKLIIGKLSLFFVCLFLVITSSFSPKYAVNTAQWPPGAFWTSTEEIVGYLWLKDNLPAGTKVFTFVNNAPILAYDKFTCHWCEDINNFQKNGFNKNIDEIYNWLKSKSYKYIVVDGQTARKFGVNETNNKIQDFINFNKFKSIFRNNGVLIFEII